MVDVLENSGEPVLFPVLFFKKKLTRTEGIQSTSIDVTVDNYVYSVYKGQSF